MKKTALSFSILFVSIVIFGISTANADSLSIATSSSGFNDTASWAGGCTQGLSSISATSANGITVAAADATGGIANDTQSTLTQSGCSYNGWNGNFAPGDNLVYTGAEFATGSGSGPITLTFSSPVSGVGTQIQYGAAFTSFTAEIQLYDESTLLGTYMEDGVSNFDANNSAVFLGALDSSGADITSAVFSVFTPSGAESGDFAIDQVSLTETPEPSSILLLAAGLVVLLGFGFRYKQRTQLI